jgi:hypothetical protein
LPEPLQVSGSWKMKLEGHGFETFETTRDTLRDSAKIKSTFN